MPLTFAAISTRRRRPWLHVVLLSGLATVAGTRAPAEQRGATAAPAQYRFQIVNSYPHDSRAFTQGLIYRDGFLYESTGLEGRSSLRKVRLDTGDVVQQHAIAPKYFAEGLTDWNSELVQLTWQTGVAFRYDLATFAPRGTFRYAGEGWGLTHDRQKLIMSDGSATLRFLSPATFAETGRITVTDQGRPVDQLNELEVVRDEIFANVWQTDRIARISIETGRVTGWIDLTGLLPPADRRDPDAVLNGIAYDAAKDRLFVTGKLWPRVFEIRVVRR
jgi:glutamine cyclotransferase